MSAFPGFRHGLLKSFFQSLPDLLVQLCGMENAEPMVCKVLKVMTNNASKLLSDTMDQHMDNLLGRLCTG